MSGIVDTLLSHPPSELKGPAITAWKDALLSDRSRRRATRRVRTRAHVSFFGGEFEKLQTDEQRAKYALPVIASLLQKWMAGGPLREMEASHPKPDTDASRHARHFVLRLVTDLAFLAGLPSRLLQVKAGPAAAVALPTLLASLASAVKEGCDSPEALAARINDGRSLSCVSSRQSFMEVVRYITTASATEPVEETPQRVRKMRSH
jgi:hypothetical protein